MENNLGVLILKKIIQVGLLNELCNKDLIDLKNTSSIIKKLEEDISKLRKNQENDKDMKNIIVNVPI